MSDFDREISDLESHLERKRRQDVIKSRILDLNGISESLSPRLKTFRSENVSMWLVLVFLGITIEGLSTHEVHPHCMPMWLSVGLMTVFYALSFVFRSKNALKKGECITLFANARDIGELSGLYDQFLRNHTLDPAYARESIRKSIQALEKEQEALEIEEEIFRQSKTNSRT